MKTFIGFKRPYEIPPPALNLGPLLAKIISACIWDFGSRRVRQDSLWRMECGPGEPHPNHVRYRHYFMSQACGDSDQGWPLNPPEYFWSDFYGGYVQNKVDEYTAFGSELRATDAVYTWRGPGLPEYPSNVEPQDKQIDGSVFQGFGDIWKLLTTDPETTTAQKERAKTVISVLALILFWQGMVPYRAYQRASRIYERADVQGKVDAKSSAGKDRPAVVEKQIAKSGKKRRNYKPQVGNHSQTRPKQVISGKRKRRETQLKPTPNVGSRIKNAVDKGLSTGEVFDAAYVAAGGKTGRFINGKWIPYGVSSRAKFIEANPVDVGRMSTLLVKEQVKDFAQGGIAPVFGWNQLTKSLGEFVPEDFGLSPDGTEPWLQSCLTTLGQLFEQLEYYYDTAVARNINEAVWAALFMYQVGRTIFTGQKLPSFIGAKAVEDIEARTLRPFREIGRWSKMEDVHDVQGGTISVHKPVPGIDTFAVRGNWLIPTSK